MKYLFFIAGMFSLVLFKHDPPAPHGSFSQTLDSLFHTVPDFSGVVLLAENGKTLYHKAFGYSNFDGKIPLRTNHIFELASVSKQFTAMIIMMLKEEGKLNYDDPVEKYIPGLPYPGVTIRHLLNHTSGLPDYQAVMDQYWDKSKAAGNPENIAYLIRYHPKERFAPNEKYEYSNTGYMLLASIAEKASGKDFIELCRRRIFIPLRMSNTDIRTKADKFPLNNFAWGHLYVAEKNSYIHADSFPSFNYSIWLGNRKGPGRVSSTAEDLLKWDQALYGESIIKYQALAPAFEPARLNGGDLSWYGFGWRIDNHRQPGRIVFHAGDNPGYKTIIIREMDTRKTLILLCNNAHKQFDDLVSKLGKELAR